MVSWSGTGSRGLRLPAVMARGIGSIHGHGHLAFLGCPEILEAGARSGAEVDRGPRGFEIQSLKNLLLSSNPAFAQVLAEAWGEVTSVTQLN